LSAFSASYWARLIETAVKDEGKMGISRIANLFAANVDSLQGQPRAKATPTAPPPTPPQGGSTDAVTVSASLQSQGSESFAEADRAARLAAIKADVATGSYRVTSDQVAEALVRDLF
jgi:anti-sigma28 factor (negative regulator of flagellin synthesis)